MSTNTFYVKPIALWTIKHDIVSNPGNTEDIEYIAEFTDEGYKLKETGKKIDVQARIQAYADECDLSTIIKGLLENGLDVSNGVRYSDEVIDVTELQNASIHERQQAMKNYEQNLAYYEAELEKVRKALEEEKAKNSNNGGENNE